MMRTLSLVFLCMASAGLWGHLEVTLFAIAMLALMRHAEKVFAKQDEEYARLHPPKPPCTLAKLEEHEQQCNAL
jgi:hypothetical protein